jgi:response regulator of citrate/malate metabolism
MVEQASSLRKEHDACPKSITDENIKRVRDMILQNRQITIDDVAHQPEISHCAACLVIHHKLAFYEVRSW